MMRTVLVLTVLLVPAAIGAVDDDWQRQGRDVQLTQTPSGATATSTADGDRIDIAFDARTGDLEYRFTDPGDGTSLRIDHRVVALVEWQDSDGDGRYSLGDRTVHRTPVDEATSTIDSRDTGNGYHVEARYTILGEASDGAPLEDPQVPAGRFTIAFDVLERARQDGTTPAEVPIVLSATDFPFREEGTELAFEVRIQAGTALERAVGDRPVATGLGNHTAYYVWELEATVDGQTVEPRVTELVRSPREPAGTGVYYAFARGDVSQAARIGTVRDAATIPDVLRLLPAGDPLLFATGALVMAGLVGIPAARRTRRRR